MTGPGEARSFPNNRAFVVQLAAGADVARGAVFGRVEHVLSAHAAHFHTLDDLLGFMARVLSETEAADRVSRDEERDRSPPGPS